MSPETPEREEQRPTRQGAEYRFTIDAFTPRTLPMARLAQYLARLADVLGERSHVHLVGIEEGSTALVHEIEPAAVPNVRSRVKAVGRGEGPRDAQEAYRSLDGYLREDRARAVLRERESGHGVLDFPGVDEAEDPYPLVREPGRIFGVVIRVGGTGDRIPILIESDGERLAGCHASRDVAKMLAHHLFEPVRLVGKGSWLRDAEGRWNLERFNIDAFEPIESTKVSEALSELRAVAGDWTEEDYRDLERIRQGPEHNGGD